MLFTIEVHPVDQSTYTRDIVPTSVFLVEIPFPSIGEIVEIDPESVVETISGFPLEYDMDLRTVDIERKEGGFIMITHIS